MTTPSAAFLSVLCRHVAVALLLLAAVSEPALAQLSRVGGSRGLGGSAVVRGTDAAFDSVNGVYLTVGNSQAGTIRAIFTDTSATVLKDIVLFDGNESQGRFGQFPRVKFAPNLSNGVGGQGAFLVTWHSFGVVHSVLVSFPASGPISSVVGISSIRSWEEAGASIAYSETSKRFLVAWQTQTFAVMGRFLDSGGSPTGDVMLFANPDSSRDPAVAWNPTTDTFGLGHTGWSGDTAHAQFRTVSQDGALGPRTTFGQTPYTYSTDLAVNPSTGNFIFAWAHAVGSFWAEFDRQGTMLNTGVISSILGGNDSMGLAYSPISGTFLAVGHHNQLPEVVGAELGPRGAALTSATVLTEGGVKGSYYPRAAARTTGASQWQVVYSRNFAEIAGQIVETSSNFGCSFSLSNSSASVGAGGGSAPGTLTASSPSCAWSASSIPSWLTVSPSSGSGSTSYNVTVTAGANTSNSPRTGVLTIAGHAFTVTQAGAPVVPPCSYSVSPTSHAFLGTGGSASFTVTATGTAPCNWTVTTGATWLTASTSGGTGSGSVTLTASFNNSRSTRSASPMIAGVQLSIGQHIGNSRGDTNGDGLADLIWRNQATGDLAVWTMNGKNLLSSDMISHGVADLNWKIEAVMDHDQDGDADLIWRNQQTGDLAVWIMNGRTLADSVSLVPGRVADLNWKIVSSGDFNGDGKQDLLWRQVATGQLAVWYMNGKTLIDSVYTSHFVADTSWQVVGADDMDGDGDADLVWRNSGNGELALWTMNGKTLVDSSYLSVRFVADANWKIVASGDYNFDGRSDLIWQNDGTGDLAAWFMNGRVLLDSVSLNPGRVVDLNWKIIGPR